MSGLSDASGKPLLYFGLRLSMSRRMTHRLNCWLSPHRFLRFAVRLELSETIDFEDKENGEPDEKVVVYR